MAVIVNRNVPLSVFTCSTILHTSGQDKAVNPEKSAWRLEFCAQPLLGIPSRILETTAFAGTDPVSMPSTKDRKLSNLDRFAMALSQIAGKRLTWVEVTGQVAGGSF